MRSTELQTPEIATGLVAAYSSEHQFYQHMDLLVRWWKIKLKKKEKQ